jgi:uncharacterized protein with GYD domain
VVIEEMATYLVLMKATEKGLTNQQSLSKDVHEARGVIEKFGGYLLDWTPTMGQYDSIAKVEFPDEYTAAKFMLTIAETGNQEATIMKSIDKKLLDAIV